MAARVTSAAGQRSTPTDADISRLGKVLSIWAHPDDETYLAGGIMAAVAASGGRVACVTATAGEAGESIFASDDPTSLKARRAVELRSALGQLGVHDIEILGAPDGGCAALGEHAPIDALVRSIDQFAPDTILTFGPDGVTGHPDHITVSRWVDLAVQRAAVVPQVLHAAVTEAHHATFHDIDERLGVYADGQPNVVTPEQVAFELVLGPDLLEAKLAALRAHRSQTTPVFDLIGQQRMAEWVAIETFVAAPHPSAPTPTVTPAPSAPA